MKRFTRLAVLAVSVLALVAGMTTPAHANTVAEVTFTGTAVVAGGIGYPVLTLTTPGVNVLPGTPTTTVDHVLAEVNVLPGTPTTTVNHVVESFVDPPELNCLVLPGQTVQDPANCHPVYDHQRTVTFNHTICTAEETTVGKAKPTEVTAACTILAAGTVTGHCGLSGGQVSGTVGAGSQTYDFGIHFTGVGGALVVSGHVTKRTGGRTGLIVGEVTAVPEVVVGGPSCTNKTQERFTIAGEAGVVIVN